MANAPATVHGDRVCQTCRGICSTGSWRTRYGQRRRYWCSELHLRRHYTGRVREACRKLELRDWHTVEVSDEQWIEFRDNHYERVDVRPAANRS